MDVCLSCVGLSIEPPLKKNMFVLHVTNWNYFQRQQQLKSIDGVWKSAKNLCLNVYWLLRKNLINLLKCYNNKATVVREHSCCINVTITFSFSVREWTLYSWLQNKGKNTQVTARSLCVVTCLFVQSTCFSPGLTGSEIVNITPPSFILYIYNTVGRLKKKKIFFMNFSHKPCSSGWRASPVQSLHAFLTRRDTPDKIPQILSAGVRVAHLMSYCSLDSHNPSHAAWLRSQCWIMRGTATEAKTICIESNTEGGRMLPLSVLYNMNR